MSRPYVLRTYASPEAGNLARVATYLRHRRAALTRHGQPVETRTWEDAERALFELADKAERRYARRIA